MCTGQLCWIQLQLMNYRFHQTAYKDSREGMVCLKIGMCVEGVMMPDNKNTLTRLERAAAGAAEEQGENAPQDCGQGVDLLSFWLSFPSMYVFYTATIEFDDPFLFQLMMGGHPACDGNFLQRSRALKQANGHLAGITHSILQLQGS